VIGRLAACLGCVLALGTPGAFAQWGAPAAKGHVVYAAEPQTVPAGRAAKVELRFHVEDGFHVNSHTPVSDLLIPTVLTVAPDGGVKLAGPEYPAGTSYSFSFDPKEKLNVYQGDFVVKVPVVASAGEHTLKGSLRYQACDKAACYPPRTLAVEAPFKAK
jgi:hypothetical protein